MGIKPSGSNPVIVPPDNTQTRWGEWEVSIDTAGQQAGEVFAETHAIATSANSVAATALSEARAYHDEAVEATEELELAIDPEHPDSHLFRMLVAIEEAQNQTLELHADAIAANDAAIQELTKAVTRTLHASAVAPIGDEYWNVSSSGGNVTLTPKPGWVGSALTWHTVIDRASVGGTNVYDTKTIRGNYPIPIPGGSVSLPSPVSVVYTVNPGTARTERVIAPEMRVLNPDVWTTLAEWTVPENTSIVADAELTWVAKTWVATYGMRLTLDGVDITTSNASNSAPIIGHGARKHQVSTRRRPARAGQILRVQAVAVHNNSLNRQVRDVKLNTTWIDGA